MKNDIVHFGGGALGRGLVIPMLHASGKAVILVDTNETLLCDLAKQYSYTLTITDDMEQPLHTIPLKQVYSSRTQYAAVIAALQQVNTVTTAVRRENLHYIAKTLAEAWKDQDNTERCVICCENVEHVGSYMQNLLVEQATNETQRVHLRQIRCPDTIVDRICATSGEQGLQITSEQFHECSVDQQVVPDSGIHYIPSVDNIEGHFYRKRYLLNAYADSISFIAKAKGYHFLYEAAGDCDIYDMVTPYLKLLMKLLERCYDISYEESKHWLNIYRVRLSNRDIPRDLTSVARNLWTKLTLSERFVYPLLELQKQHVNIQEGLCFIIRLIRSEQQAAGIQESWGDVLSKLRECWCTHPEGEELFEAFRKLQNRYESE